MLLSQKFETPILDFSVFLCPFISKFKLKIRLDASMNKYFTPSLILNPSNYLTYICYLYFLHIIRKQLHIHVITNSVPI